MPRPCCKECGQPLQGSRHGVYLTPAKLRLFEIIERRPGMTASTLAAMLDVSKETIRTTICQINDLYAATDIRIKGSKSGRGLIGYTIINP